MAISINILDQYIEKVKSLHLKPKKILIGYRAYAELMNNRIFFDEVIGSAMEPNQRTYRQIRIKITQDDHQLEIKT